MLRCSRLSWSALLGVTAQRRAPATVNSTTKWRTTPLKTSAETAEPPAGNKNALQHAEGPASNVPSPHLEKAPEPPLEAPPRLKFLFKGRRGDAAPEYYVSRSNAGHPDAVAELLGGGRDDPEWMWLKLLCFCCTTATFGTSLYGYFFAEHVKYFKDEPWSPFTY